MKGSFDEATKSAIELQPLSCKKKKKKERKKNTNIKQTNQCKKGKIGFVIWKRNSDTTNSTKKESHSLQLNTKISWKLSKNKNKNKE